MFVHEISPVLFSIGPFTFRWYGLIFAFGIALAYIMFRHLAHKKKLPLSPKDFDDYMLYGIIGVVAGARLGSVLSDLPRYAASPLEIFAIWNGGMAFHGGLAGLVVAGLLFSRKKGMSFYSVADLTVIPAALGLAFGRIGNFINGEFYGTPTGLPWGVKFPAVEEVRHPVQLYESLKNFLIFSVLWSLRYRPLPPGTLFWLFVTMYGVLRFGLEFYKDLPPLLAGLTWGQIWSLPMVAVGVYMLYRIRKPNVREG